MVKKIDLIVLVFTFISCGLLNIHPREKLTIHRSDQREDVKISGLKINGIFIG